MTHQGSDSEFPMLHQYRAWIRPDSGCPKEEHETFFTEGVIVLDTNVLLDLYRYTPGARGELLAALRLLSHRLWLPYQVGIEFVRQRRSVIFERLEALKRAGAQIDRAFNEAWRDVAGARDQVKALLGTYAADEQSQALLDELITQPELMQLLDAWRRRLQDHVTRLREDQDIQLSDIKSGSDVILPQIAELFGDQVALPPSGEQIKGRVQEAIHFRYPNQIPPGFADQGKSTDLRAAGDFLLWEEVISYASKSDTRARIIFVSRDTKEDWYEQAAPGLARRPWPSLLDEFRRRTGKDLLIVEPSGFFAGIKEHLNADITPQTAREIERTAESLELSEKQGPVLITSEDASVVAPPPGLAMTALEAARLSSPAIRSVLTDIAHRQFQWWLIGVTAELQLREREDSEPLVEIESILRTHLAPSSDWLPGTEFPQGALPARSSFWAAPWMVEMVNATPNPDRAVLLRLALRQLTARTRSDNQDGSGPGDNTF
jgi:hypothetical protein